ncbi:MAG: DUF5906 domain-containing protein [Candidatus Bipolaricaulis sp.]|nr:DUF5906 domain-containing protein [Candidatus Bipolaricaulis sp.]
MKEEETPYIRVGTCYFKKVKMPLVSKDFLETIIKWNAEFIKQDMGRDFLSTIPKYDGFCVIPDHINYQPVVGSFYNKYLPFEHTPRPGEWPCIEYFLKHIFQHQYPLILDYFKLLVERPTLKLPVICLVSWDRNTGKTTFLQFLKALFGGNMTINTNEDFKSSFNSEWIAKLIIGVDETFLDKKEDSERLKNLSTARSYKSEAKGQDRYEVEFFGKFVLCANKEDRFLIIEPGETRYWVVKVNPFEKEIIGILDLLKKEIPFFLYDILKRSLVTENESRMWFNPKLLETEALKKVMRRSRSKVELELLSILTTIIENKELTDISFCINDIQNWLEYKKYMTISAMNIKRILQNEWKLEPTSNTFSYTRYWFTSDGSIEEKSAKGRYYKMDLNMIMKYDE